MRNKFGFNIDYTRLKSTFYMLYYNDKKHSKNAQSECFERFEITIKIKVLL